MRGLHHAVAGVLRTAPAPALRLLLGAAVLTSSSGAQAFTEGNLLVKEGRFLVERTPDGEHLRAIEIPNLVQCGVALDAAGRAHVLSVDRTGPDYLNTYDPVLDTWSQLEVSVVPSEPNDGDLSVLGDYLFTKNQRIRLSDLELTDVVLPGFPVAELSAGYDGLLYAIRTDFRRAHIGVVDPESLVLLDEFDLVGGVDARAITATPDGSLYVADDDGTILHYDPTGQTIRNSIHSGSRDLRDIHLASDGRLVVAGEVSLAVTDLALSGSRCFRVGVFPFVTAVAPPFGTIERDVGLLDFEAPTSGSGLGSAERLRVTLANLGTTPVRDIPIEVSLDGPLGGSRLELIPGPVGPLTSLDVELDARLDLSTVGRYRLKLRLRLPGDEVSGNDGAELELLHQETLQRIPYTEAFELGDGGYVVGGAPGKWVFGAPTEPFIGAAADGGSAWFTVPRTACRQETAYLQSPRFDCRGMTHDPFLQFDHIFDLTNSNSSIVEVSIDGGPFTRLGSRDDPGSLNWYQFGDNWRFDSGEPGVWRTARHIVPGGAGHVFQARWRVDYRSSQPSLVGVDAVRVFEAPFDAGQRPLPARSTLDANGALEVLGFPPGDGYPGPYYTTVSTGGQLELSVTGEPSSPVTLLGGTLSTAALQLPIGQLDVFPFELIGSGLASGGLNTFLFVGPSGELPLSLSVPTALAGQTVAFQAVVHASTETLLGNAVQVEFVP